VTRLASRAAIACTRARRCHGSAPRAPRSFAGAPRCVLLPAGPGRASRGSLTSRGGGRVASARGAGSRTNPASGSVWVASWHVTIRRPPRWRRCVTLSRSPRRIRRAVSSRRVSSPSKTKAISSRGSRAMPVRSGRCVLAKMAGRDERRSARRPNRAGSRDGRRRRTRSAVVKILDERGARDRRSSSCDLRRLAVGGVRAARVTASGAVWRRAGATIAISRSFGTGFYYDVRAEVVRFDRLEPGDVIDFEYVISDVGRRNLFRRLFFRRSALLCEDFIRRRERVHAAHASETARSIQPAAHFGLAFARRRSGARSSTSGAPRKSRRSSSSPVCRMERGGGVSSRLTYKSWRT